MRFMLEVLLKLVFGIEGLARVGGLVFGMMLVLWMSCQRIVYSVLEAEEGGRRGLYGERGRSDRDRGVCEVWRRWLTVTGTRDMRTRTIEAEGKRPQLPQNVIFGGGGVEREI